MWLTLGDGQDVNQTFLFITTQNKSDDFTLLADPECFISQTSVFERGLIYCFYI